MKTIIEIIKTYGIYIFIVPLLALIAISTSVIAFKQEENINYFETITFDITTSGEQKYTETNKVYSAYIHIWNDGTEMFSIKYDGNQTAHEDEQETLDHIFEDGVTTATSNIFLIEQDYKIDGSVDDTSTFYI